MGDKKQKHPRRRNEDRTERDKNFLMVAGVSFFMTLIVVLWFFNIQSVFQTKQAQGQQNNQGKMEELKNDLSSTWRDVSEQVDKIQEKDLAPTTTSPTQTTTTEPSEITATSSASSSIKLEELKRNIEKELK